MHLIIPEIDTVYTPKGEQWEKTWHGLETPVEGGIAPDGSNVPEVFQNIVQCGVRPDFEAEVAANVPDDLKEAFADGAVSFKQWKLILADCRKGKSKSVWPLHVPKKGYAIHQNKRLYDCMIASAKAVLGGDKGFQVVTVGTLGGYTQFFVSIAIKGKTEFKVGKLASGANDTWKQFFNLNSSHNGLISSTRNLSLIRQVCWNTVNASIAQAEAQDTLSTIKHTANSGELLTPEVFAKDLEKWLDESKRVQSVLATLKDSKLSLDGFRSFATGVFTRDESDKLSTTSYNRVTEMEALFAKGQGNRGESVYDAVNAFTEYFTSGSGVGNASRVKQNKRIASANFGRGNQWKLEALRIATDEKEFKATLKRGERLFTDYLKVAATSN